MDADDITQALRGGFGAAAEVRARRPSVLFQVHVPAFLSDGDAASIFVRPRPDGRVVVTDLGKTRMRISYYRDVNKAVDDILRRLAERHGFRLDNGELIAEVPLRDLVAGAFGLIQIESEAEAAIAATTRATVRAESFRQVIRSELKRVFESRCILNFHDEQADPEGLFAADALIRGPRNVVPVVVVPSDIDAERAVGVQLNLDKLLAGQPHQWVAVPRDLESLHADTRKRLVRHFFPVPAEAAAERISTLIVE